MRPFLLPVLLLTSAGCSASRIPVPEPLSGTPEWAVRLHGWRGDRMTFGPYEAAPIEYGTRHRGGVLDALSGKRELQRQYRFLLRDTAAAGADPWQVACDHRDVERTVGVGAVRVQLDDRVSLECRLHPRADSTAPWTLRMATPRDRAPAGELRQEGHAPGYEVRAHSPSGRDCCYVGGYLVRREGREMVLVDRTGRGTVRLAGEPDEPERGLLAAAAAALMLVPYGRAEGVRR